ncbi:Protein N-acetyltransferase, RimJ/RimL family [Lentzea xinjiangensis]|uniref:Protein N-acetyltransferase, RimJ/RimL family n=1 Tax=Lentzea xinjiangensis TaxID=402600 RepID=A0A1H9P2R3_9PSEU|nr:GNAT family N-acetyltransferase [Lentzea xinjiangensis]SER42468.1 Protein N-acetyltransferase, RimJ/RimL family [Lentzea xinjiangensis]
MGIRKLTDTDAAELLRVVTESLAHLRPWAPWAAGDYDASTVTEFLAASEDGWERGTSFTHAITVDDAIIGVAAADRPGHADLVEIGYWLHPAHTGRGHATAAAAELVEFAFALDGVHRVQIWHDEANVASSGVPRRLGFTEIGRRTPPREPAIGRRAGVDVVWELRR